MKNALLCCLLLVGLLAGCKEDSVEPDPDAIGYTYYPLAVGDYRIYNVMDIKFTHNVGDTTRFQLREVVDTTFVDQTNTLNYKIVRSTRPNANAAWVEDSVLVVTASSRNLILTKDNTKYVKLVFPVKEGKTWVGDAYNDHALSEGDGSITDRKELYKYEQVGQPYELNGRTYPETLTVIQGNPTKNFVLFDERKEVYAKGAGMVYRLFNRVVYCNDTNSRDCEYGVDYKLNGHERHEVLIEHGTR
ncbi:MAG: hypothetical protein LPK14_11670 [Hymenobacteraceae bacterium]|nr:hypothetical protein [Hymenobacteraceae bacterium]